MSPDLGTQKNLGPGTLVLVVGPSGSGKDTLLRGAMEAFKGNHHVHFVRRAITRASDPEHEDHDTISQGKFQKIRENGNAAFTWEAHGHGYVIPKSIENDISSGKIVIFNASRSIIEDAKQGYDNLIVINISVPASALKVRIENRGRESGEDVEKRLTRAAYELPDDVTIIHISNDGTIEAGIEKFVSAISNIEIASNFVDPGLA